MTRHTGRGRTAGLDPQLVQLAYALFTVVALTLLVVVWVTTRLSSWIVLAMLAVGVMAALVVAAGGRLGGRVTVHSAVTSGTGHRRLPAPPVDHVNGQTVAEQPADGERRIPGPHSPARGRAEANLSGGPGHHDHGGSRLPGGGSRPVQPAQPARDMGVQLVTAASPSGPEPQVVLTAHLVAFDGGTTAGPMPWRLSGRPAQSGIAADSACIGDLDVRAASVVGPGHRCEEPAVERQDAYGIARTHSGSHLVVAVADGLSSSPFSELGARVAVSTATRTLCQHLDGGADPETVVAETLFVDVSGAMIGTGEARGIDRGALGSLLVVAVVPTAPLHDGSRRVWTAQVGDVSLWIHGPLGWDRHTGVTKSGMDRNAVDAALPFDAKKAVTTVVTVPPGAGIAVMTDGLGDVLGDVSGAVDYFARRWATPPHPAAFVADLCVDARGQTDDRTAVVVWCRPDTRRTGTQP